MKWLCTALLGLLVGDIPGKCDADDGKGYIIVSQNLFPKQVGEFLGYFIMTIGGSNASETYIPDVELTSIDPMSMPVPDCLTKLSGLGITRHAGGLDYSGKFVTSQRSTQFYP